LVVKRRHLWSVPHVSEKSWKSPEPNSASCAAEEVLAGRELKGRHGGTGALNRVLDRKEKVDLVQARATLGKGCRRQRGWVRERIPFNSQERKGKSWRRSGPLGTSFGREGTVSGSRRRRDKKDEELGGQNNLDQTEIRHDKARIDRADERGKDARGKCQQIVTLSKKSKEEKAFNG